jgi:hypothetical protein
MIDFGCMAHLQENALSTVIPKNLVSDPESLTRTSAEDLVKTDILSYSSLKLSEEGEAVANVNGIPLVGG